MLPFHRAAADGYTVRGFETAGAGAYIPVSPKLHDSALALQPGTAVGISAGLPDGADMIVPLSLIEETGDVVTMLKAMVRRDGGKVEAHRHMADDAAEEALRPHETDAVLIAGSRAKAGTTAPPRLRQRPGTRTARHRLGTGALVFD